MTVKHARKAGLSWAEIATALGVSRQAVWERWHDIDATLPANDLWGPSALHDPPPESNSGTGGTP
ncbi:AsnC family protein [Paenarthrobacter sp. YJN-5]|uniref:AsnC family protein n=1 Tax=Paenarthrobacter sp. YJN-5 TaxID=2735316 RepID=UPI001D0CD391|nr:AsnC family protein [Paenarthrobacter sp. YJN-5]